MLRPGVVRSLRRTLALRVPAHVVSRCHPDSQAAGALAAAGLRVHGSPDAASVSPSQTPSSKSGQPTARVSVHGGNGEGGLGRLKSYVPLLAADVKQYTQSAWAGHFVDGAMYIKVSIGAPLALLDCLKPRHLTSRQRRSRTWGSRTWWHD